MKKLFFLSIYVILFVGFSASFWSCQENDEENVQPSNNNSDIIPGEGEIVTKIVSLESFTGVDVAFAGNVTISQGATQEVKVTGYSNIIDKLKTEVDNNIWTIGLEEGNYDSSELLVEITVPNINVLKISGSGNLTVNDFTGQTGDLTIDISGSGQLTFNAFEGITDLNVSMSSSGSFTANQDILSLETLTVNITGSGNYLGYNITSPNCNIQVSNSGNVAITVNGILNVTITGSGNVSYLGIPTSIIQNITGIGILINGNSGTNPCGNPVTGQGTITTETISIANFTGIDLLLANNVTIIQGTSQEVKATGHPNIIDSLTTDVVSDIWRIALKEGCYENYELSIEITVPNINSVKISGSGNVTIHDFTNQSNLSTNISGSGQITTNIFEGITTLDVNISGSGKFVANQDITSLTSLNVDVMGSGNYLAYNISSPNADIDIFGSGSAEVTASNTLVANIFGSGNISYKGNPTITQNIVGTGQLIDAN